MLHPTAERLAALVDGTPLPDEAAHLAACATCRAALDGHRRLLRLAAQEGARPQPPLSDWGAIAARLTVEDVIVPPARARARRWRWVARLAAGLTLLAGGAALGRASAGVPVLGLGGTAGAELPTVAATAPPEGAGDTAPVFRTPDEAVQALSAAQRQYQDASAWLAAQDTTSRFIGLNRDTYRTRLAALDEMAAATRAALYRAPQDPVLTQYYLSALGAREVTLRQIGATLGGDRRLERY